MNDNDEFEVGYHLVGFIYLLGQQEELSKLSALPDAADAEQMSSFTAQLKRTFGVVDGLHGTFEKFFRGYTERRSPPESLKEKNPELYDALSKSVIKFQRYSDGIVVFVPLSAKASRLPLRGVWGLMCSCASAMLLSLAAGHPLRGGLDVALGMEMREGELYGPAMARAYNLESKVAQYPRIVVGEELLNYLLRAKALDSVDPFEAFNREMAGMCLELVTVDVDGNAILDYLSEGFRKYAVGDHSLAQQAYDFALSKFQEYRRAKDSKLAVRYKLLVDYMQARLAGWDSPDTAGG